MIKFLLRNTLIAALLFVISPFQRSYGQCSGIDFTASKTVGCAPAIISFYASGAPKGSTYSWNMGNGTSFTGTDTASNIFSSTGTFDISLEVTLPNGTVCTITKTQYITIGVAASAGLIMSPTALCNGPGTVMFIDTTSGVTSRNWVINGVGYTNGNDTISQFINTYGQITVTLQVFNALGCTDIRVDTSLWVYNPVVVDFTDSTTHGCVLFSTNFTPVINANSNNIVSYDWTFTGGSPSTYSGLNPGTIQYASPGSYPVSLSVTTAGGCTYTTKKDSFINVGDTANITYTLSDTSPCKNDLITIINTTGNLPGTFTWTFQGSAFNFTKPSKDVDTVQVAYSDAANQEVILTYDYNGCTTNKSIKFKTGGPTAGFVSDNRIDCVVPHTVDFKDQGTGPGPNGGSITYKWYFYDTVGSSVTILDSSTASNPSYTYKNYGDYKVKLVITSSDGCIDSSSKTKYVSLHPPDAKFSITPKVACPGQKIVYKNSTKPFSPDTNNFVWFLYDKNFSSILLTDSNRFPEDTATYTLYSDTGYYPTMMIVYTDAGCIDTFIDSVWITKPHPAYRIKDTTICAMSMVTLISESTPIDMPLTIDWMLYNATDTVRLKGDSAVGMVNKPGYYNLFMQASQPGYCLDSIRVDSVLFVGAVDGDFTLSGSSGCPSFTINATGKVTSNTVSGKNKHVSYKWVAQPPTGVTISNDTISNPTFTFTGSGQYSIALTLMNGDSCSKSILKSNVVSSGVKAGFSIDQFGCFGNSVSIKNSAAYSPTSWNYTSTPSAGVKFSLSSTDSNPTVTFPDSGTYTILQTVKKAGGCVDTVSHTITIERPVASFYSPQTLYNCAPALVQYVSTSAGYDTLVWDFGDGSMLRTVQTTASHLYTVNNNNGFDVCLYARSKHGCWDTICQKGDTIIGPVPHFNFNSPTVGCSPLTVKLSDSSFNIARFVMNYGDGTLDSSSITSHTYVSKSNKAYDVFFLELVALDNNNCFSTFKPKDSIVVYKTCIAGFSVDQKKGCEPMGVTFTDSSFYCSSWLWDFGDGTTDTVQNPPTHFYAPGTYSVTLTVNNAANCGDAIVKKNLITIYPRAKAGFKVSDTLACQALTIQFTDTSTNATRWKWDFEGDGIIDDTSQNPSHLFPPGTYSPTLWVTNQFGCPDSIIHLNQIRVDNEPTAAFSPNVTVGCEPLTVTFTDASTYASQWFWDFDSDGTIDDTAQNPVHVFNPGVYSVTLYVLTPNGCDDTISYSNLIRVYAIPTAGFTSDRLSTCFGQPVTFTDASTTNDTAIVTYHWDFGDIAGANDTSNLQNPLPYTYQGIGTHDVSLTVTTAAGCSNTYVMPAMINVIDSTPPIASVIDYVTLNALNEVEVYWNYNNSPTFFQNNLYANGTYVNAAPPLNTPATVQYNVPGLNINGAVNCFYLTTNDSCNYVSQPSTTHCTVLLSVTGAVPNTNLLSWTPYVGWTSVNSYEIWRAEGANAPALLTIVPGTQNTYNDSFLCDFDYCYYVIAIHPNGNFRSLSNTVCNHPPFIRPDLPVTMRRTTVLNDAVTLTEWDPTGFPAVKYYQVDRFDSLGTWTNDYARVMAPVTSFVDPFTNVHGQSYIYRISEADYCGNFSQLSDVGTSILLDAKLVGDYVNLSWNDYNSWPNGVGQFLVQIRTSLQPEIFSTIATLPPGTLTYIDPNLYPDLFTNYCYRIVALENEAVPDTSISNVDCAIVPSRIYVPNAFTPNGKGPGQNEVFKPSAVSIYNLANDPEGLREYEFIIYDRWGQEVFRTNDLDKGWDGTLKGKPCQQDVYIYVIRARGMDGYPYDLSGNVHLLR